MTPSNLLPVSVIAAQHRALVKRLKAAPYIIVPPPREVIFTPNGRVEITYVELGQ